MATQHPDNARKLSWYPRPVVSTLAELKESFLCFKEFDIDEYNWDWEGKFVDEEVYDRLLHNFYNYFSDHPIGKEKFITFRIPNPRVESQFRLARAFMVAITSSQHAKSLGFSSPPIFEAILPLTETAEDIFNIQEAFAELVSVKNPLLKMDHSIQKLEVIPLFEQVSIIINSADILRRYLKLYKNKFRRHPEYIRPYIARSDPALNSGIVPTVLAAKVALSEYQKFQDKSGVALYPLLGTGSLPFRGSMNPENLDNVISEYKGVATFTIQSAFRYDYPKESVKKAVARLKKVLPQTPQKVSPKDKEIIKKIIPEAELPYRNSVELLAPLINKISKTFPKRRERLQHIGLFGYSRGVGKVKLPRAIPFTGSLYSIGLPPELIGTGRILKRLKNKGLMDIVLKHYIHLKNDMIMAGYFLNKENIARIGQKIGLEKELKEDIEGIETTLNIELGPKRSIHHEHKLLTNKIYKRIEKRNNIANLITASGKLRRSLG
ncbi:phosphoenolpyruvate carboxylase [Candidatus Gottesmanbacteria bacterium]|nr:phosphoenolpyruvate carboxylase [Candidatus Gottesmanbacteria bacterium]